MRKIAMKVKKLSKFFIIGTAALIVVLLLGSKLVDYFENKIRIEPHIQRQQEDDLKDFSQLRDIEVRPDIHRQKCSSFNVSIANIHSDMALRLTHMHDTCQCLQNNGINHRTPMTRKIIHYPNTGVAYCKVPKVGCTFLFQMFYILESEHENETQADVFGMPRHIVHNKLNIGQSRRISNTFPTVITARDPFTRLYSAYVDKIFLQLQFSRHQHILNKVQGSTAVCNESATFEGFLKYVLGSGKGDGHWTPVSSICGPCSLHPYIIIKQETYNEDIETLMTSLNVNPSTYKMIKDAMTVNRIESTLPGYIDAAIKFYESHNGRLQTCHNIIDALNIVWTSFQIQGFIHRKMDFPKSQFRNTTQLSNESTMIKAVFVDAARTSNLSRVESLAQRRQYLINAYKGVSSKTLKDIVKLFDHDFLLFNYDMSPPK